jgi:hypothetical protein
LAALILLLGALREGRAETERFQVTDPRCMTVGKSNDPTLSWAACRDRKKRRHRRRARARRRCPRCS